jgi:hypothetical protein
VKDRPGGIDKLKNRSGKCEGPGGGARRVKEPEWQMRRTGRGGVDGIKNRSEKCEGPGRRGGTNGCLKRKVFFKNQKHQPNIVEITHLCIMHGVRTSSRYMSICDYITNPCSTMVTQVVVHPQPSHNGFPN